MVTHSVKSKAVHWIRYDDDARVLEVEFESSLTYRYFDVPRDVYEWLLKVESKGRFINRLVKDKFRYERIEDEAPHDDTSLMELLERSLTDRDTKS